MNESGHLHKCWGWARRESLLALLLILVASCSGSPKSARAPMVDQPAAKNGNGGKLPVVLVESAAMTDIADTITYPARVISKVQANVQADSEGVVTKVLVALGRTVRGGEAVLRIKNTDPVYEYVPITLKAPLSGVISALNVTEGAHVTKGQSVATITDPAQLRIVIEVPASDLGQMRVGLSGSLRLPVADWEPLPVRVEGVSPLVDPATGTASVELALPRPSAGRVPLGLVGKVSFEVRARKGIQLPEQAIISRGNQNFVRIVEGGLARLVPVTVAETRRGMTEVTSGLKEGALVILQASGFVADGQPVSIKAEDVATP